MAKNRSALLVDARILIVSRSNTAYRASFGHADNFAFELVLQFYQLTFHSRQSLDLNFMLRILGCIKTLQAETNHPEFVIASRRQPLSKIEPSC